jgi:hypothetical protein
MQGRNDKSRNEADDDDDLIDQFFLPGGILDPEEDFTIAADDDAVPQNSRNNNPWDAPVSLCPPSTPMIHLPVAYGAAPTLRAAAVPPGFESVQTPTSIALSSSPLRLQRPAQSLGPVSLESMTTIAPGQRSVSLPNPLHDSSLLQKAPYSNNSNEAVGITSTPLQVPVNTLCPSPERTSYAVIVAKETKQRESTSSHATTNNNSTTTLDNNNNGSPQRRSFVSAPLKKPTTAATMPVAAATLLQQPHAPQLPMDSDTTTTTNDKQLSRSSPTRRSGHDNTGPNKQHNVLQQQQNQPCNDNTGVLYISKTVATVPKKTKRKKLESQLDDSETTTITKTSSTSSFNNQSTVIVSKKPKTTNNRNDRAVLANVLRLGTRLVSAFGVFVNSHLFRPIVNVVSILAKCVILLAVGMANTFQYAIVEIEQPSNSAFACYVGFYLVPVATDVLMRRVSLPHYTPHLISSVELYWLCHDKKKQYCTKNKKQRRLDHQNEEDDPLAHDLCKALLQCMCYLIPLNLLLLEDCCARPNTSWMMASVTSRLLLAYTLSIVRANLVLSPVAWTGWAVQVLLAAYMPRIKLTECLLLIVGLANVRLACVLQQQLTNGVENRGEYETIKGD